MGKADNLYKHAMHLQLHATLHCSISTIEQYFSSQELHGYICDKCHNQDTASARTEITKLPMILCIHLKRFASNNTKITEIDIVDIPEKFISSNVNNESVEFRLCSIVNHLRHETNKGHYTASQQFGYCIW